MVQIIQIYVNEIFSKDYRDYKDTKLTEVNLKLDLKSMI